MWFNKQKDIDENLYKIIIKVLEKGTVTEVIYPCPATMYSYKGLDVLVYYNQDLSICIKTSRYKKLFNVGLDITKKVYQYFNDQCANKIQEILNDD